MSDDSRIFSIDDISEDDYFVLDVYKRQNQNIANQNIRKLDVTGKNTIGSVSDLSLIHILTVKLISWRFMTIYTI